MSASPEKGVDDPNHFLGLAASLSLVVVVVVVVILHVNKPAVGKGTTETKNYVDGVM